MKCRLIGLRLRLWFALSTRRKAAPVGVRSGRLSGRERGRGESERKETRNERKAINVNCSTHESLAWPPSGWQLCRMSLTIMWLAHTHTQKHTHAYRHTHTHTHMRTHMTITAPKPREHFSGASNSLEPLQSANVQDMFLLYPLAAKPTRPPSPPSLSLSLSPCPLPAAAAPACKTMF